jgi:type 1 glutamine amidotransferase
VGGYYERPYSKNPQNDAKLTQASPKHPISRGWKSFAIGDEWYYKIRFTPGDKRVTPILTSQLPPSDPHEEIVAWATERKDGGRGFGFTGLHRHQNWNDPDYRRLLVNAILWTSKNKIPKDGAKCDLEPGDLEQHLFPTKR